MPPKQQSKGRQPFSADYYEAEIRRKYKEFQKDPTNKKKQDSLRDSVRMWAIRSQVDVLAASNEGDGFQRTPEEIGYPVKPMPRYEPKKWNYHQVCDYLALIKGVGWYQVGIERKTLEDLYGTLIDDDHRRRLNAEITRFYSDPRFCKHGIFRMEIECPEKSFYDFFPPFPKNCNFCSKQKMKLDSGDYWCPEAMFLYAKDNDFKNFYCPANEYQAKIRTPEEIDTLNKKKATCIRRLRGRGVQIVWRGDRETANSEYKPDLQSWMIENYERMLGLGEYAYDDEAYIKRKIASCEAELQALRASLEKIQVSGVEV